MKFMRFTAVIASAFVLSATPIHAQSKTEDPAPEARPRTYLQCVDQVSFHCWYYDGGGFWPCMAYAVRECA